MNTQPSLFDQSQPGYSRSSGAPYSEPTTSREAAESVSPKTMKHRSDQFMNVLRSNGARGAALFEIAATLGVPQHWLTSTAARLYKEGRIRKSPRRVLNAESGKECVLLVAN